MFQHLNHRGARRKRTTARNWKLIWTNNEGELPHLVTERDFQEIQRAQRVPKKLDPRRNTPRHIITLPKIKDKERILKTARGKERVTYKGVPMRLSTDFSKPCRQERAGNKYLKSWKARTSIQDYSIQQSYHLESVSYTHLTLPTTGSLCRSRWSPYH